MIEEYTLVDGGQTAEAIADRLVGWLASARSSLDIALYDVRLPGPLGDAVAGAIRSPAVALRSASAPSSRCPHRRARSPRCWRRWASRCARSPAGPT